MIKLFILCLAWLSCSNAVADAKFNINEYFYEVPNYYRPVIDGSVFTFYLDFPSSELNLEKVGPTPDNNLRIRVEHKKFRTGYTTKIIKRDGKFIYKKSQFNVYREHIGKNGQTEVTSYLTTINSEPIVISQAGELNLRVYRSAGKNRELDYVYSKEITIQQWVLLDKYIMKILGTFRRPLLQPASRAPNNAH